VIPRLLYTKSKSTTVSDWQQKILPPELNIPVIDENKLYTSMD